MTAAGGDRGDNTARCDLCDHAPHPTSHCVFRWPGGLRCSCADRQTDEERPGPVLVARCEGVSEPDGIPCTGRLRYRWGMSQAACDTCGGYHGVAVADWIAVEHPAARPAVADAVMADLGAAITEGVTEVRLREALRAHLASEYGEQPIRRPDLWLHDADAVLALPEMRALLDAAAKVQRVEALAATWERRAAAYGAHDDRDKVTELRQRATALRLALDGQP